MATTEQQRTQATRRRRNLGTSLILAALAVALAATAVVYLQEDDDEPGPAPIPQGTPGANQAINVKRALEAQGLEPEFGRGTVKASGLTQPGQILELGDARIYVFVYGDAEEQVSATAELDPATLLLTTPSGTPVAGAGSPLPDLHTAAKSNIFVVLAGGTPEQIELVDAAIASLP